MTVELKKAIESKKVLFGIKQSLKHSSNLDKAFVSSDARDQIKNLLKMNKIDFEVLEDDKEEISNKTGMNFECEVFGIKK